MLHYLPGCDVRKNHPQAIHKIERYMKENNCIIESCCRVKDKFLNEGDTIVNNCTLCQLILKETHSDNECLSLYEYVLKDDNFPWINHNGEEIVIQDCWRTRDNLRLQLAIRTCLLKMNFTIIEMKDNFNKTKYCGVWLNNKPTSDCIEVAPVIFTKIIDNDIQLLSQEEQIKKMQLWIKQYSNKPVLVYCNGCERGIKLGGGKPIHIVELLGEGLK